MNKFPKAKFRVNSDIEQVLTEKLSHSSNEIKIEKVDKYNNDFSQEAKIRDRIELSSNKDIEIGLDLLANKDKQKKSEASEQEKESYYDNSKISIDDMSNKVDDNLISELNLDSTSRLSDDEIDNIIEGRTNLPNLTSADDIENAIEEEEYYSRL